jgi:hypothetical protein
LLGRVATAFKAITTVGLDESVLVPEKRDRFVLAMQTRAPMLSAVRRILMASFESHIDRLTYTQILDVPAAEGEEFTDDVDPATVTNKLIAVKARGRTNISDEAMRDNIEKADFENTLVDAIAAQAGVDLERLFVRGDVAGVGTFLGLTDGWLVKAGNVVTGAAAPGAGQFDQTDPEDMFEQMALALDERFVDVADRSQLTIWTTFTVENDYRDILRERGTDLGDLAQTQNRPLAYKGFPIRTTPAMPAGKALLSHLDNLVYGIWQEIGVEPERKASHDRTDFHVRVRADANYEDEDGAVAASGYVGPA